MAGVYMMWGSNKKRRKKRKKEKKRGGGWAAAWRLGSGGDMVMVTGAVTVVDVVWRGTRESEKRRKERYGRWAVVLAWAVAAHQR